jgi:hypothetical protein
VHEIYFKDAISTGNIEIVKMLFPLVSKYSMPLYLTTSIVNGRLDTFKFLRDDNQEYDLHMFRNACIAGQYTFIRYFLTINRDLSNDLWSLETTIKHGYTDIMDLLLSERKNKYGIRRIINDAIYFNQVHTLEHLVGTNRFRCKGRDRWLKAAVKFDNIHMIKILLTNGKYTNESVRKARDVALKEGKHITQILLTTVMSDISPYLIDQNVVLAISIDSPEALKLILDRWRPNINEVLIDVLKFYAIRCLEFLQSVDIVFDYNNDIFITDIVQELTKLKNRRIVEIMSRMRDAKHLFSKLMTFSYNLDLDATLMDYMGDFHVYNDKKVVRASKEGNYVYIDKVLTIYEKQCDMIYEITEKILQCGVLSVEVLNSLLNHGLDINYKKGRLINVAIERNLCEVVEYLIQRGANSDFIDKDVVFTLKMTSDLPHRTKLIDYLRNVL